MVSIKLKQDIRKTIGKGIATKFFEYLADEQIKKENDELYSKAHLRTYIYSELNNDVLDKAFLNFANQEITKIQNLKRQKAKLQKNLKKIA